MDHGEPRVELSREELGDVTAQLSSEARELRGEIAASEESEVSLREDCELDAADVGAENDSLNRLREQMRQARLRLERVESALARLQDGTFGLCAHCGRPVSRERLLAMPTAELCVRCQSRRE